MAEFEGFYTPRKLSLMYGGTLSEAEIRAACHRARNSHPLPHIKSGAKRPVLKIRPSVFESWLSEEMGLHEAVGVVDGGARRRSQGVR